MIKTILAVSTLVFLTTGCSQQMISPTQQTVIPSPEMTEQTDCNLNEKYQWLTAQGRDVEMLSVDEFIEDSRGYFAFSNDNDANCDEVINHGDYVTRFRGGEEQEMSMGDFMNKVVGDTFIRDNDPR